jgi:GNAT superfamily N-acetyltransferase
VLVASFAERPDLVERLGEIGSVWPEFALHDAVVNRHWDRLADERADFQFVLYDEATDEVVGGGRTVPFAGELPGGVDEALERGFGSDAAWTDLCALEATVSVARQGQGLSRVVIEAMSDAARRHGLESLVAPVRPTLKHRYPLTPIERYVEWRREDGLLFDPWLRVHERLGAELIGIAEASMLIEAPIADWENWTGMVFPDSGAYIVEGALVPVSVDRERDLGRYVEPNVWMRHSL